MKTFFATFFAILAAAAVIVVVAFVYKSREHATQLNAQVRHITLEGELSHAQSEWNEHMRRNPQFDPSGDKLVARLREIREASDAGKPIPPSRWR